VPFDFLATTNLKTTFFRGVTPCGLAEIHQSFMKICFLLLLQYPTDWGCRFLRSYFWGYLLHDNGKL